jgi:hypothetical protein
VEEYVDELLAEPGEHGTKQKVLLDPIRAVSTHLFALPELGNETAHYFVEKGLHNIVGALLSRR